jgi:Zn ribbon nucleic-acid-binding protein
MGAVLQFKREEVVEKPVIEVVNGEVRTSSCPWCGDDLHRNVADVVHPGGWRRNNVNVAECGKCEFIAEPIFQKGILINPTTRKEIFVFKAKDVQS